MDLFCFLCPNRLSKPDTQMPSALICRKVKIHLSLSRCHGLLFAPRTFSPSFLGKQPACHFVSLPRYLTTGDTYQNRGGGGTLAASHTQPVTRHCTKPFVLIRMLNGSPLTPFIFTLMLATGVGYPRSLHFLIYLKGGRSYDSHPCEQIILAMHERY